MAQNRIAGVAYVKYDGRPLPLEGGWTVNFAKLKREGKAGQSGVNGYKEMPEVPSIEGEVATTAEVSVEDLVAITNATVQLEAANGKVYVLRNAWTADAYEIDTEEGKIKVKFEGLDIDEIS